MTDLYNVHDYISKEHSATSLLAEQEVIPKSEEEHRQELFAELIPYYPIEKQTQVYRS